MPVGDTERGVAASAQLDGIQLEAMPRVSWLNTHGHFGLPDRAASAIPALQRVFEALGGDETEHRSKRRSGLPSDLVHHDSQTMIEVDEVQHFTSFRDLTLREVATFARFDNRLYAELCETWSPRADRYRATKNAKGFPGPLGRARQRAYNDLLRDLVAPLMGYRVIRVPAPHLSGSEAYAASSQVLAQLLGAHGEGASSG